MGKGIKGLEIEVMYDGGLILFDGKIMCYC